MFTGSRSKGYRRGFQSRARPGAITRRSIMTKSATKEGTTRYAQKFAGRAATGHFREAHRLVLSSVGIGTYLGQPDAKTDEGYTAAAVAAAENRMDVFGPCLNHRLQPSQRSLAPGIR